MRSARLAVTRGWILVALVALVLTGIAQPVAAVTCGDTVGPGGTVTLDSDLLCAPAPASPKLVVIGPLTLDLNGHTIDCGGPDASNGSNVGILVDGLKAHVRNGTIRNCDAGVRVSTTGAGQHTISDLGIADSGYGIRVSNMSNTLSHNTLRNNGIGIALEGAGNLAAHNIAIGNGVGIYLTRDTRANRVMFNSSTEGSVGFRLSDDADCDHGPCADNLFIGNVAAANSSHGFSLAGAETVVLRNRVVDNGGVGIEVKGTGQVSGNTVNRNGGGGVVVAGKALVQHNVVKNNGGNGIAIMHRTSRSIVFANTVLKHDLPHHDVVDATPFCLNVWMDNTFRTRSGQCDIE